MDAWRIVITGCGTSHGSPPWGWPQYWSNDPRDHRRRSGAVLLGPHGQVLLIDAGPDLMHQLRDPYADWDRSAYPHRCITRCDGVFITHDHADHIHGINELRHLNRLQDGTAITLHGHGPHLDTIRHLFPYCFSGGQGPYRHAKPNLHLQPVIDGVPLHVADLTATAFAMLHGPEGRSTGYRFGNLAYCTDVKHIPEASYAYLQGLDVLVLGMLREEVHETHMNWDEARTVIDRVRPRATILVHMGPEVRYGEWETRLPENVVLAYDGMDKEFTA